MLLSMILMTLKMSKKYQMFWGLFKRAIVGSYHKLSVKHLDAYIQECCFKYNNRNNANMFDMLLINCVK